MFIILVVGFDWKKPLGICLNKSYKYCQILKLLETKFLYFSFECESGFQNLMKVLVTGEMGFIGRYAC